ncbi:MAG: Membrane dipeptidase, partial [candidate division NC10 bacterium]|nr:Membrane dipeptidase [candidate division NC10 bacterium]
PAVVEAMVKHGYSAADIVKIGGGNWMRVFRAAWRD